MSVKKINRGELWFYQLIYRNIFIDIFGANHSIEEDISSTNYNYPLAS